MMGEDFLDALLSIPKIYRPLISKDSKHVVYAWLNVHPNIDVFAVPTDGSKKPFAITETPEATFPVSFSPDSKSVIVGQDKGGNERVRLYEVFLDRPGHMIPLTEDDPPYFLRGGMLHPNRRWLVYGANFDADRKKEIEPTWIYRQDLKTGEKVVLAKPRKPAWTVPVLNSWGDYILYNRKDLHPRGDQYWLVDIEGRGDREILNFGAKARVDAVWLPDGCRIAFMSESKGGKLQKYYSVGIYHVETGETEWVIDDPKRNVERILSPWNGNHLVVIEYWKSKPRASIIELNSMEEIKLPEMRGALIPIGPAVEGWAGLYYSSTQPDEIVIFNPEDASPSKFKPLTHVWDYTSVRPEDLVPAESFEWKSRDGLTIHGWLYRSMKPSRKAVIYVHGGPTAHVEDEIIPLIQYLAHEGFNVLAPNYRGSTGYGLEFEDLIRIHGWGSEEQEDIWAGAEALVERGIAEKGMIGITGASYGGYSSWYAITKAPDIFKAAVPICGMTDLVVDYETTRPDLRPYSEQMLGGSPEEVPEIYYERSPINYIHRIKGRLLIVQGANDPNVTPRNAEEVVKRLDRAGIEYELLVFEDEGHGILKKKNKKILYRRMAEFFHKTLQ